MLPQATARRSAIRHSRLVNYTMLARRRGVTLPKLTEALRTRPRPVKSGLYVRRFLEIDRRS